MAGVEVATDMAMSVDTSGREARSTSGDYTAAVAAAAEAGQ